jgi:hypothetical protein
MSLQIKIPHLVILNLIQNHVSQSKSLISGEYGFPELLIGGGVIVDSESSSE